MNSSVMMLNLLPIVYCQDAVRAICTEVEVLVKKCGKPKMIDAIKLPPPELYKHVEVYSLLSDIIFCSFYDKKLSVPDL